MDERDILFANDQRVTRPPLLQDSVSQLWQLSHLLYSDPKSLVTGKIVEIPLATRAQVTSYFYELLGRELLDTPVGKLDTLRIKASRAQVTGRSATAEYWFAPELNYLPVRLRWVFNDKSYT
ncbi:MAG: DUF3108 domain-containing protein [Burkholderiales bacterium]